MSRFDAAWWQREWESACKNHEHDMCLQGAALALAVEVARQATQWVTDPARKAEFEADLATLRSAIQHPPLSDFHPDDEWPTPRIRRLVMSQGEVQGFVPIHFDEYQTTNQEEDQ